MSGIPCFTHGSTTEAQDSFLLGNDLDFSMDDGSAVVLQGTIDDVATTRLLLNAVGVTGGNCTGSYELVQPGSTLSR